MSTTPVHALAQLGKRDVKALTQPMDVYAADPATAGAHEVAVYHRGERRIVNVDVGFCTCEDAHYRDAHCKHLRRAEYALGEREIPPGVNRAALDASLRDRLSDTQEA
jgi:hypothetical protein